MIERKNFYLVIITFDLQLTFKMILLLMEGCTPLEAMHK